MNDLTPEEEEREDTFFRKLFDLSCEMRNTNDYSKYNEEIDKAKFHLENEHLKDKYTVFELITILRLSWMFRDKLTNWDNLYYLTRQRFDELGEETDRLLIGLSPKELDHDRDTSLAELFWKVFG